MLPHKTKANIIAQVLGQLTRFMYFWKILTRRALQTGTGNGTQTFFGPVRAPTLRKRQLIELEGASAWNWVPHHLSPSLHDRPIGRGAGHFTSRGVRMRPWSRHLERGFSSAGHCPSSTHSPSPPLHPPPPYLPILAPSPILRRWGRVRSSYMVGAWAGHLCSCSNQFKLLWVLMKNFF